MGAPDNERYEGPDRRHPLTPEELHWIKQQLLEAIYAEIGKSVTKKLLWVFGAVCLAAFAWMMGAGHLHVSLVE